MTAAAANVSVITTIDETDYRCVDCGDNTFPSRPPPELQEHILRRDGEVTVPFTAACEVFIVRNFVWKRAGMKPWGGCLCIGCLENRIGRRLKPKDFPNHVFNTMPGTARLRSRRGETR
jgi:hypothetical protein